MKQIRIPLLVSALLAVAVITAPAGGQQKPKPTPCGAGAVTTDPKGDAFVGFAGSTTPIPADDNQDITNLFFRNDGTTVTANLGIANLSKTVPPGTAGNIYRLFWTYKDVDRFIDVEVTPSGDVTYTHGHFEDLPVGDGDTAGQFHEGADGVIAVTIPKAAGGVPGTKLDAIRWNASTTNGVVLMQSDVVPDSDEVAYSGAPCEGGGPTGPAPTATPGGVPTPGPQPSGPGTEPRKVTLKVSKVDKAKKASKKKKLGLSLAASETLTAVAVQLQKGTKVLGTARTSSLGTTPKRFKIKVKKKVKKGGYALTVSGKNATGADQTAVVKFRVK